MRKRKPSSPVDNERLTVCAWCNMRVEKKDLDQHHISYLNNKVVPVHRWCHQKITALQRKRKLQSDLMPELPHERKWPAASANGQPFKTYVRSKMINGCGPYYYEVRIVYVPGHSPRQVNVRYLGKDMTAEKLEILGVGP